MMSPNRAASSRSLADRPDPIRHTPLQLVHVVGIFLRTWSVYSLFQYFSQGGDSVVVFIFRCLIPASVIFLVLHKPWKGRSLSNMQVIPSVINGGIMAVYLLLWVKGLKSCGPLIAILAEYAGAILGVLSAVLYGRRSHIWKKVGGLVAMLAAFYFLSLGWATSTRSPFYSMVSETSNPVEAVGMKEMILPITAGIFSALRRVIARRVSLKNQLKRRLHAITVASATCFLFPLAMWDIITGSSGNTIKFQYPSWAYVSTIMFGMIFIFYVDNVAEDRLHLVFSSPKHLMLAGGSIIVLEILYKMDFSLLGFLVCSFILGFGIYEATSLERVKRDPPLEQMADGLFQSQLEASPLPT